MFTCVNTWPTAQRVIIWAQIYIQYERMQDLDSNLITIIYSSAFWGCDQMRFLNLNFPWEFYARKDREDHPKSEIECCLLKLLNIGFFFHAFYQSYHLKVHKDKVSNSFSIFLKFPRKEAIPFCQQRSVMKEMSQSSILCILNIKFPDFELLIMVTLHLFISSANLPSFCGLF